MSGKYFYLVTLLICSLFINTNIGLAAKPTDRIPEFLSEVRLNKDGTVDITEKITYTFAESSTGITREIPLVKTNQENQKFRLNIQLDSVTDEKDMPYAYEDITTEDTFKLQIGDPNKIIEGTHTYVIKYKVTGALTYFGDYDEIYWNVTGNSWPVSIARVVTKIVLPQEIFQRDMHVQCFTGTVRNCEVFEREQYIDVEITNTLEPNEDLTIVVKFPTDIITKISQKSIPQTTESTVALTEQPLINQTHTILLGIFMGSGICTGSLVLYRVHKKRKKKIEDMQNAENTSDNPAATTSNDVLK